LIYVLIFFLRFEVLCRSFNTIVCLISTYEFFFLHCSIFYTYTYYQNFISSDIVIQLRDAVVSEFFPTMLLLLRKYWLCDDAIWNS